MQVRSLEGNTHRLDGGGMFGNCPRSLWSQWMVPDEQNRIGLACRSLLICENDGRKVLLEAGVGLGLEPRLRARYGVPGESHMLLDSLQGLGIGPEEIDVLVLSHLHFDHAGGLLTPWREGTAAELVFSRARFVVSREAWERSRNPHPRDRASFIPGLCDLLERSGRLSLVEGGARQSDVLGDSYELTHAHGHTPGLLITRLDTARGPVTFTSDCAPGVPWLRLPITMGFDRHPELLVEEKRSILQRILNEDGWVFFTHDPKTAACRLREDGQGRLVGDQAVSELCW